MAHDSFLAQLGSMLWGSMKHVIAPSVSHRAHHYYEKLSFQLYFVTQEVNSLLLYMYTLNQRPHIGSFLNLQKVRSIKQLPVNVKSITDSLNSVLLRHQKSMFSQQMYDLISSI